MWLTTLLQHVSFDLQENWRQVHSTSHGPPSFPPGRESVCLAWQLWAASMLSGMAGSHGLHPSAKGGAIQIASLWAPERNWLPKQGGQRRHQCVPRLIYFLKFVRMLDFWTWLFNSAFCGDFLFSFNLTCLSFEVCHNTSMETASVSAGCSAGSYPWVWLPLPNVRAPKQWSEEELDRSARDSAMAWRIVGATSNAWKPWPCWPQQEPQYIWNIDCN